MSALGGILTFGGGPVDRTQLASLGARLERLGPDGGREVIAGSIGMTYRAFATNAESRREHQPYCWGHQAMLAFDGRLDNRDELLATLRDELRGDTADAALVMAAYLHWGVGGIARLLGDFALAIWDRRDRALCLARDCVGARTLYYHLDGNRVIWSTDLGALLDTADAPLDVNDEYIADLLTCGVGPELTPYVGVHAVKPAHVLRIDGEGAATGHRFWVLDPHTEIRYQSDGEYEEHFRSVFCDAVRARLRSDRTVFAELSGGLDSSSIVCVAHHLLKSGEVPAPDLETVSYVFDESSTSDERRWIAHVDAWRGQSGLRLSDRTHPWLLPLEDASCIALPNVVLSSCAFPLGVRQSMRMRGARVLLVGTGGDELLHSRNNPMPELADLFAAGRLRPLHRRLRTWSRLLSRSYADLLWNDAVIPNLPRSMRARFRSGAVRQIPDWLDSRFASRMNLRERIVASQAEEGISRPSGRMQARAFRIAAAAVGGGHRQEVGGCDVAFPYLDRRLVEFLQGTPIDQKLRCGESRSIMRRGLRTLVPDAVLKRKGKGDPTEAAFRGLGREAHQLRRLIDSGRIVSRGYVDAQMFRAAFDRAVEGRELHSGRLMLLLTIELWLRAVERRLAPHQSIAVAGERAASAAAIPREAAL